MAGRKPRGGADAQLCAEWTHISGICLTLSSGCSSIIHPYTSVVIVFKDVFTTSSLQRSVWTYQRPGNWWQYVHHNWTDREWQANFRMRQATFYSLCNILRPWLTRQNTKYRLAVPVEVRVGVCIWRLATNLEYRSISHLFGVGLSTCCRITQEVVTAINFVLKPKYIRHPTAAELRVIVQGFRDRWHFPQVAGAIDGTHIKIRAPAENSASYYNRKGDYSIILQLW
ncbi:hypothetical protein WMY93_022146 [Mugilogobius chulae]|uniref:DDE Tnp4 domain-containing protein n=1 Tax=Mugilogobius chulae TaxID=88201 RepID=A0AAW0NIC3_9GOBI